MKKTSSLTLAGKTYKEGEWISLDGSTGNIYGEAIPTVEASIAGEFERIMDWADQYRQMEGSHKRRYAEGCKAGSQALEHRASVFAVQSICSLMGTELRPFREMICSDTVEAA